MESKCQEQQTAETKLIGGFFYISGIPEILSAFICTYVPTCRIHKGMMSIWGGEGYPVGELLETKMLIKRPSRFGTVVSLSPSSNRRNEIFETKGLTRQLVHVVTEYVHTSIILCTKLLSS